MRINAKDFSTILRGARAEAARLSLFAGDDEQLELHRIKYAAELALAILCAPDYIPSGAAQANARALLDTLPQSPALN